MAGQAVNTEQDKAGGHDNIVLRDSRCGAEIEKKNHSKLERNGN